ncbi:hypothetical protein [Sphingobium baderi]|uniref:Uncharacterized protein n=1 Tax=Sphingobium baderi LL03 TaxID=1114964 RepID=T0HC02_9SPHN|nr:hypothetical protein [Sphingobium baderi]EQA96884.1 hypothetical protein L485_22655 [Sphingobium baderi LL03]KMS64111.1 hypothetical protein V475_20145 [Sphingobium baderi LL03]
MADRIILNIEDWSNATLAVRAARYLIDNPEKSDCLLEYGDSSRPPSFWAKRGKGSIIVYEQPSHHPEPSHG